MSTIDIHFEKKIDNSRIVRDIDLRCRLEYLCLTLLGAIFVLGMLFYAWQQYQWIQYGYQIEEAQKKIEQLQETRLQFQVERATLSNPHRIDAIARGELGMVEPGVAQVVTLEVGLTLPSPEVASEVLVADRIR